MRTPGIARLMATVAALLAGPAAGLGNGLLVNPGFETPAEIPAALPTGVGYWAGDLSQIVGPSDGITPQEGSGMLKFDVTGVLPEASHLYQCEVQQLADLTGYSDLIAGGGALARISCRFNRVAGDEETDTRFYVVLRAYDGSPADFPWQFLNEELLADWTSLTTDADPATWEPLWLEVQLPPATDYVAVRVVADEDVFNDTTGTEFDGHYADAVTLEIVPEPCALALMALGGAALLRRRRKAAGGARPTESHHVFW